MFRRIDPLPAPLLASRLAELIPSRELRALARWGTEIRFAEGRTAMREDDVGRECMVIIDGEFSVVRHGEVIAEAGTGDVIGEVALLTNRPRSATVTATEPGTVYAFSRRDFLSLLDECPAFAAHVRADAHTRALAS